MESFRYAHRWLTENLGVRDTYTATIKQPMVWHWTYQLMKPAEIVTTDSDKQLHSNTNI